jgi:hypothetical protein
MMGRGRAFVLLGPAAAERRMSGPVNRNPKMDGGRMVMPPRPSTATPEVLNTVAGTPLEIAFD